MTQKFPITANSRRVVPAPVELEPRGAEVSSLEQRHDVAAPVRCQRAPNCDRSALFHAVALEWIECAVAAFGAATALASGRRSRDYRRALTTRTHTAF